MSLRLFFPKSTLDRVILFSFVLLIFGHGWSAWKACELRRSLSDAAYQASLVSAMLSDSYKRMNTLDSLIIRSAKGAESDIHVNLKDGAITVVMPNLPAGSNRLVLVPLAREVRGRAFHMLDFSKFKFPSRESIADRRNIEIRWICLSDIAYSENPDLMARAGNVPGRYSPRQCRDQSTIFEQNAGKVW